MKFSTTKRAFPSRIRRWLAVTAVLLGIALVAGFGWRAWKQFQFNQRVASGEIKVETLRSWMTLAYIEQVYGVPQSELRANLGLPATGFEDRSVHDWGENAHLDPIESRHIIESLILKHTSHPGAAK
jgi:hypothetical protein